MPNSLETLVWIHYNEVVEALETTTYSHETAKDSLETARYCQKLDGVTIEIESGRYSLETARYSLLWMLPESLETARHSWRHP